MSSSVTTEYVKPGACIAQLTGGKSILTSCALEPRFCQTNHGIAGKESETFVPSERLEQLGESATGYSCLSSDGMDSRHYVHLGRCASEVDQYLCTSVAENCRNPSVFETSSSMCTLLADLAPDRMANDRSRFNACLRGHPEDLQCYWSKSDCPVDEGYQNWGVRGYNDYLQCDCEETKVGACKSQATGKYHCAVSKDACEDPSTFLTVKALQQEASMECRLCEKPNGIPEPLTTAEPVRPLGSSDAATTSTNSVGGGGGGGGGDNKPVVIGAIVGAVVGGLALAGIVIMIAVRIRRRRTNNAKNNGGTAIVVELASETNSRTDNSEVVSSSDPISA